MTEPPSRRPALEISSEAEEVTYDPAAAAGEVGRTAAATPARPKVVLRSAAERNSGATATASEKEKPPPGAYVPWYKKMQEKQRQKRLAAKGKGAGKSKSGR